MAQPLAYFLTAHTDGTWLHGGASGSVDSDHNRFGEPLVEQSGSRIDHARQLLKHPPLDFTTAMRQCVQATIIEVASHRNWRLLALHIRTTHFHCVVAGDANPEKMLIDFKSYATRRLREVQLTYRERAVWSEHGSTRYLWDDNSIESAVTYTVHEQGSPLLPLPFVGDCM